MRFGLQQFVVGLEVAYELALFEHRVAMVGVMFGSAHRTGGTLMQSRTQLHHILSLAQQVGVFLLAAYALCLAGLRLQSLDVGLGVLNVQAQFVEADFLLFYGVVPCRDAPPQRFGTEQHLPFGLEAHGTLLHEETVLALCAVAVHLQLGLQRLGLRHYLAVLGVESGQCLVLLLLRACHFLLVCQQCFLMLLALEQLVQSEQDGLGVHQHMLVHLHALAACAVPLQLLRHHLQFAAVLLYLLCHRLGGAHHVLFDLVQILYLGFCILLGPLHAASLECAVVHRCEALLGLLVLLGCLPLLFHQFVLAACEPLGLLLQQVLLASVLLAHVLQDAQAEHLLEYALHLFVA